jgi:ABC-2 type transport system permease protein
MLGFLSLPMIFLSTALVPLSVMPVWMRYLAQLNPMTWAIDAIRPLILSGWAAAVKPLMIVVLVMVAFDALSLYGASRAFRRTLG